MIDAAKTAKHSNAPSPSLGTLASYALLTKAQ